MDDVPRFMIALAEQGEVETALEYAHSDLERFYVHVVAGNDDAASDAAQWYLDEHNPDHIEVHEDTVTVYCGPFVGVHSIREDYDGEMWATEMGSYEHPEVDFTFKARAPDPEMVDEAVSDAVQAEPADAAARAAYRQSRL